MSDKLYEISDKLAVIHDQIIDADGELTEELEKRLDECNLAIREKTGNIARWILNIDGKVGSVDVEIERLQKRKKFAINLQERLKEYIRINMVRADIQKIETDIFTIAVQKNPPSVDITNEEIIPAGYKVIKQIISVDKKQLLNDLKEGKKIEGCHIVLDKTHLRIR